MTTLPPNVFDFGAPVCTPDEAAVVSRPQAPATAADISDIDSVDLIGEIFIGAAKLEPPEIWFENSAYPREDELLFEVLEAMADPRLPGLVEMPYGMEWALDPAPLFLQKAG